MDFWESLDRINAELTEAAQASAVFAAQGAPAAPSQGQQPPADAAAAAPGPGAGAFPPTVGGMPQLRPAVAAPEGMQRPATAAPSQAAFQPPRPPPFASALQAAGQKTGI